MKLASSTSPSHQLRAYRSCWRISAIVLVSACLATIGKADRAVAADDNKNPASQSKVDDVLHLAIEQYEIACDKIRSSKLTEEERLRFYSDWKERIGEAIKANPKSPFVHSGTVKLLGIANSLGDSQTAERLAKQLAEQAKEPRDRLHWHTEMGEVAKARYEITKDRTDADRAIASFTQAAEDYREIAKGHVDVADRDRHLINLCMKGALYGRALSNHQEAARVFQEVRESLTKSPPSNQLATLRYDFEYATSSEMVEWLAARNTNKAEQALDALAARTGMRWAPSYYAHLFVSNLYPQGGNDFQAFVDKWLAQKPQDEWTPFLRFYLARDYFFHKEYLEAQPIFSDLKEKYADVFLKADQEP